LSAVDFNSVSDSQFKTNIEDINDSWSVIGNLRPVKFDWKHVDQSAFGFIAQEVEKIVPDLVATRNNSKTLSYIQLIPLLIHTIQEMNEKIARLEAKDSDQKLI
jgi:hypothetical protein